MGLTNYKYLISIIIIIVRLEKWLLRLKIPKLEVLELKQELLKGTREFCY